MLVSRRNSCAPAPPSRKCSSWRTKKSEIPDNYGSPTRRGNVKILRANVRRIIPGEFGVFCPATIVGSAMSTAVSEFRVCHVVAVAGRGKSNLKIYFWKWCCSRCVEKNKGQLAEYLCNLKKCFRLPGLPAIRCHIPPRKFEEKNRSFFRRRPSKFVFPRSITGT